MKKLITLIASFLALTSCASQTGQVTSNEQEPSFSNVPNLGPYKLNDPFKPFNTNPQEEIDKNYIKSLQEFALDFLKETHKEEKDDNPVFSPMSIATCFSMAMDAATGQSKEQLESLLHYDDSFDHLPAIKTALLKNAINDAVKHTYVNISQSAWINEEAYRDGFDEEYSKLLQDNYFAEFYKGPLPEMYNEVADWINSKTNNYLNVKGEQFRELLEGAVFALLNTIYFKSDWHTGFDEEENYNDFFNNFDGTKKITEFMKKIEENQYYYESSNYRIASIPFEHGLEFRFLLPNENTSYMDILDDRTALNKMLTVPLNGLFEDEDGLIKRDNLKYEIPQVQVRQQYNLVDMCRNMGITSPFEPRGEFPPIKGYIAKSIHEAGFEINNQGGEGAAYTVIVFEKAITAPQSIELNLNHPFAYSVSTSDGIPLFMGKVTNFAN